MSSNADRAEEVERLDYLKQREREHFAIARERDREELRLALEDIKSLLRTICRALGKEPNR